MALGWRSLALLLCVGVVSLLSSGCPTVVPYQANDTLITTLGVSQAKKRLQDTVLRAINPQMVEVEVTDDFLLYRFRQVIAGFPTGAVLENRLFFMNAAQVEVFANNIVNVRTAASHLLAQIVFGSAEDVQTFADLVTSFRMHRSRSASSIR
jgi:hypothetical protein